MKITNFTRSSIGLLRSQLEEAIAPVAKIYGLEIVLGAGSFTRQNFTLKLKLATKGDGGKALSEERESFRLHCGPQGLKPEDIDRTFCVGGRIYKIIGLNPKAFKFPIIGQRVETGVKYKFPSGQVKAGLI